MIVNHSANPYMQEKENYSRNNPFDKSKTGHVSLRKPTSFRSIEKDDKSSPQNSFVKSKTNIWNTPAPNRSFSIITPFANKGGAFPYKNEGEFDFY